MATPSSHSSKARRGRKGIGLTEATYSALILALPGLDMGQRIRALLRGWGQLTTEQRMVAMVGEAAAAAPTPTPTPTPDASSLTPSAATGGEA